MSKANELTFQNDMIRQLQAEACPLGKAERVRHKIEGFFN